MHAEVYSAGLDQAGADAEYFEGYGDVRVHGTMLRDRPRVIAYREALSRAPLKGKTVLDVGAGCGILSLLAARAGARKVWAVEASPVAALLKRVVAANGFDGVITVLPRRVEALTKADVGGGCDVLVSEWMGFFLLHESMLPSVLAARDTLLNPAGPGGELLPWQMMPHRAALLAAPVELAAHRREHLGVWSSPETTEGFDLSPFAAPAAEAMSAEPLVEVLAADSVVAVPQAVLELDLLRCSDAQLGEVSRRLTFPDIAPAREVHGVSLWFDVEFSGSSATYLRTGPGDPPTHWKQTTVVLPEPLKGPAARVEVSLARLEENARCYALSLQFPDSEGDAAGGAEAAERMLLDSLGAA